MKRLVAKKYASETVVKNPECFDAACGTVNLLYGLGYKWDTIKTRLIDAYGPYNYAHPDLELIQTIMGIQEGRDLR